jgi:hypothetical protein
VKRIMQLLAVILLLAAPQAAQAQFSIFGGQQRWTADGTTYTGTGGGVGIRTSFLPLVNIMADASYHMFPEEAGGTPSSINYSASAVLGKKKDRVSLYAGIGQYDLRFEAAGGGTTSTKGTGLHAGLSIHLLGPLAADVRYVMVDMDVAGTTQKQTIIPISVKLQF